MLFNFLKCIKMKFRYYYNNLYYLELEVIDYSLENGVKRVIL